jgi:hypothetical protein
MGAKLGWGLLGCGAFGRFCRTASIFSIYSACSLGRAKSLAAQQSERPGGGIIDQVHCTVCYGGVLLANFYHGFHQSSRMESQEARIVCGRGTIRLF